MSLGLGGSKNNSSSSMNQLISSLFNTNTNNANYGSSGSATSTTGTETGTNERILSPEQQAAQTSLGKIINQITTNPGAFLAPAQNQAREDVNSSYGNLADSLRQQFMGGTGGGASGKYGTAALAGDLARRKQLSGVDTSFDITKSQLPLTAAQLSQQLLNTNLGTKVAATTTGTGETKGTTENVGVSTTTGGSSQATKGTQDTSGYTVGGSVGI